MQNGSNSLLQQIGFTRREMKGFEQMSDPHALSTFEDFRGRMRILAAFRVDASRPKAHASVQ